jgi:hypothetical protein
MQEAAARIRAAIDGAFDGDAHPFLIAVYKDPEMPHPTGRSEGYEKPRLNASEHNLKSSDQSIAEWLKVIDGSARIPSDLSMGRSVTGAGAWTISIGSPARRANEPSSD